MDKIQFSALLRAAGKGVICLDVPKAAFARLGTRGRVAVVGTLNGHPIRAAVVPTGSRGPFIHINDEMQKGAGVGAGDRVRVVLEVETAARPGSASCSPHPPLPKPQKAKAASGRAPPSA